MSRGISIQGFTQEKVYWRWMIWIPGNDLRLRNPKPRRGAVRIHGDLLGKKETSKVGGLVLFVEQLIAAMAQGCKCKHLPGILEGRRTEKRSWVSIKA